MRVVWLFSLWHKKKRFRNLHQLKNYNYSQLQALRATLTSFFKIFHFGSIIYYFIYLLVDLPGCFYTFTKTTGSLGKPPDDSISGLVQGTINDLINARDFFINFQGHPTRM